MRSKRIAISVEVKNWLIANSSVQTTRDFSRLWSQEVAGHESAEIATSA